MPHVSGHGSPHGPGFTSSIPKPKPKPKPQSSVQYGPPGGSGSTTSSSYGQNSAQNQLAAIVANKQNTQNQAGLSSINPNVVGDVFGGADPNTIPYNQMNEAQKVFANFYGSSTPNLYQQQIQDFITASPENMQVYKDSGLTGAGLNAFMTTFPEALASNTIVGNILKNLKSTPGKIKEKLSGLYNTPQVQEILGLGEEDKNIKSSYSQYMNEMNKKIGASRADTGEISGETTPLGDIYGEDYIYDKDYMLPGAMEEAVLAGQEPYNPAIAEDKEAQAEMDRSLENQYSLLQDKTLADSLIDKSMQTDETIDMSQEEYDQELKDRLPFLYDDKTETLPDDKESPSYPSKLFDKSEIDLPAEVDVAELGLGVDTSWQDRAMPEGLDLDALINLGASQEQIAQVLGVTAADGGSVNYKMLKLINDTMHDG